MVSLVAASSPWRTARVFSIPMHRNSPSRKGSLLFPRVITVSAAVSDKKEDASSEVRVRFAPSPTGNLHVGGARTALFNYLFARSKGGKFVLRIEDTDLERSTLKSEEAMLEDLSWLGLGWDEGPDSGGEFGPYRQSERNTLYKQYAEQLLKSGHVYRCFCSTEELERMKETAKLKNLPPVYTGKWATATNDEIAQELEKGTPFTYRFHVPREGTLKIDDLIRGEVSWNLNTLGDFVILRSNGQPVYNFCVTVDDATMHISHVIRAEEHLPNTLRQALIYKALGFSMPHFAHVSLILSPDKSKLSKRHGATSVGQFREMGYLPQAMVNYLALLGWGDGTENEFFTIDEWMNGQHLRALPSSDLVKILGKRWRTAGLLSQSEGEFVEDAATLLKDGIDLVTDADKVLADLLSYPLHSTLASSEGQAIVEDNISEVSGSLISAYDSGEFYGALEEGHAGWQKWVKCLGKSLKRKGKALFMPMRVLLTGKLHGPDMGSSICLLHKAGRCGVITNEVGFKTLDERFKILRDIDWDAISKDKQAEPVATGSH
ncbi:unnamed protein product [Victoria cruziana]